MASLAESPEFHLSKKLQPGDIEIVHNPTIFHSRGEVFDGEVSSFFNSASFGQRLSELWLSSLQSDVTLSGQSFLQLCRSCLRSGLTSSDALVTCCSWVRP